MTRGLALITIFMTVAIVAGCNEGGSEQRQPMNIIVGLTVPKLESDKKRVFDAAVSVLIEAPLGSNILYFDASQGLTITEASISVRSSSRRARVRIEEHKNKILKLKNYLNEISVEGGDLLNVPKSILYIGEMSKSHERKDVLLIGQPLYTIRGSRDVSMNEGLVPSVGHLCASRQASPFSTEGIPERFEGANIYIYDTKVVPYKSAEHELAVGDFWKAMIEKAKGVFVVQSGDAATVLSQLWNRGAVKAPGQIDCANSKLEWMRFPRPAETIPVWVRREYEGAAASVRADPPVGRVKIAIIWQCKTCDFDLYSRSRSGMSYLYYGRALDESGLFYKDFASDPKIPYGFEYIEYIHEIDLRQLEVLVNFHGGKTLLGEAKFTFRMWFQPKNNKYTGGVVEKEYSFQATEGNKGRSLDSGVGHWIRINALAFVAKQ